MAVLKQIHETSRLVVVVVDDGHLRGIISMRDMMRLISVKLEIEEGDRQRQLSA